MGDENEGGMTGFPFVLNGYEFRKCIGRGTFSTAFKVMSLQYGLEFCAKMTEVEDDQISEIDPELAALASLDNENVIKVYRYFKYDSLFFLILELCEGGTIADRINKTGKMRPDVIRVLMTDVLKAMIYCHDQNIAHRDIKPANIFMDAYGHAKVADFGLASIMKGRQLVNTACGSPSYLAPEIYRAEAYDPFKADVWALGVTLYQMAIGRLPWPDEICCAGPDRPPLVYPEWLDRSLKDMIISMLQIDPKDRPTMKDLKDCSFFTSQDDRIEKVRASLSLRGANAYAISGSQAMLSVNGNHQHVHHANLLTQSAALRIGSRNAAFDKRRRASARVLTNPLTFGDQPGI